MTAEDTSMAGKVVLITGASGNIGQGLAGAFAQAGARLVLHCRSNPQVLDALAEELAAEAGAVVKWQGDVHTVSGAERLVACCMDECGQLDCLINNAGQFPSTTLQEMTEQAWSATLDANLTTAVMLTRAAAAVLQPGAAIVNIASIEAHGVFPAHSHYAAAKAGLVALTRNCAYELGPRDITVNAVSPGLVARPGLADDWPAGVRKWCEKSPLGRVGTAADVAAACLFLCGPGARWITGSNLVVDGGMQAAAVL